MNLEMNISSL